MNINLLKAQRFLEGIVSYNSTIVFDGIVEQLNRHIKMHVNKDKIVILKPGKYYVSWSIFIENNPYTKYNPRIILSSSTGEITESSLPNFENEIIGYTTISAYFAPITIELKNITPNSNIFYNRAVTTKAELSIFEITDLSTLMYENEFLAITGPTGPTGPKGIDFYSTDIGPTGPIGPTGLAGAKGISGTIGLSGNIGATGPVGIIGSYGATGATGNTGPTGAIGIIGNTGPTGPTGPIGPFDSTATSLRISLNENIQSNFNIPYSTIIHQYSGANELIYNFPTGGVTLNKPGAYLIRLSLFAKSNSDIKIELVDSSSTTLAEGVLNYSLQNSPGYTLVILFAAIQITPPYEIFIKNKSAEAIDISNGTFVIARISSENTLSILPSNYT